MHGVHIGKTEGQEHSEGVTFNQEQTMGTKDFDELAGRINGVGQALLRAVAELEFEGFIDGPRVSASMRRAADSYSSAHPMHRSTRFVLLQLAQQLDESRAARQERAVQG